MIILLHGPGETGKRDELVKIKSKFNPEAVTFLDLQKSADWELKNALRSIPLFVADALVVAENIPTPFELEKILPEKLEDSVTLVLIVSSTLPSSSRIIKYVSSKGGKIFTFEAEKEASVFPYLDNLIEGKPQSFLELKNLQREYGSMYLLSMIYYLLRRNFLPLPASSFMQNKIKNQKSKVSLKRWEELYKFTLDTEYKIKTGLLEEGLAMDLLTQRFLKRDTAV